MTGDTCPEGALYSENKSVECVPALLESNEKEQEKSLEKVLYVAAVS